AAQMLRFAWGRANIGRWSLAVMLLSLHPETQDAHALLGFDVLGDLLLGLSMMIIVLHDSRVQIQRLDVLNRITRQSSNSGEFVPTIKAMLEELIRMTGAKGAWVRTLEGDRLVMLAQAGMTPAYAENARSLDSAKSVSAHALRESEVCVLLATE